jgi:hypothetical protein
MRTLGIVVLCCAPGLAQAVPDARFSFEFLFLPLRSGPVLSSSSTDATTRPELSLPAKVRPAVGLMMNVPAIRNNHLRFSYFQMTGSGDTTAGSDLVFFSEGFSRGDLVTTGYKLQTAKVSLDFLSYPFPPEGSTFRLKTLWEVQVTGFRASLSAPLADPATSERATGTLWFGYPTFGLGIEQFRSPRFRWEAKVSGFALPGYAATWDAEAKAAFRRKNWETIVGVKGFYFRTSPKQEEYVRATLPGLYVGLRWYPGEP